MYRTVKSIGSEKTLANLANYKYFSNFHNFHNIPYANGLQFAKVFSTKLPTFLICQSFYRQSFYCMVLDIIKMITCIQNIQLIVN